MTQRYFNLLFILGFGILYFGLTYFFEDAKVTHYFFIWVFCAYSIGQYSTKFPKE